MSGVPTVSMVLYQDALKRIAELEAQNEQLEREARNAGKDIALSEAKKRISELEAERESWGNEFNAVTIMKEQVAGLEAILMRINEHVFPGSSDSIDGLKRLVRERDQYYTESKQQAERIAELELANNRLRKTWREDTEDLAKVRVAHRRELEKQAERISHLERKEVMWDQENRMLHRVCAENARLREALDGLKKVCDSDNSFASRVGMMSALIDRALESRQETNEIKDATGGSGNKTEPTQQVTQAPEVALGPSPETLRPSGNRAGETNEGRVSGTAGICGIAGNPAVFSTSVRQESQFCRHGNSGACNPCKVGCICPGTEQNLKVRAHLYECPSLSKTTVQATTEEAATEAERKLGWDKPAVQDTGGQRCVCGHRGLWHEQSGRYIICESPGCECLQFTPIVTAQAKQAEPDGDK